MSGRKWQEFGTFFLIVRHFGLKKNSKNTGLRQFSCLHKQFIGSLEARVWGLVEGDWF